MTGLKLLRGARTLLTFSYELLKKNSMAFSYKLFQNNLADWLVQHLKGEAEENINLRSAEGVLGIADHDLLPIDGQRRILSQQEIV